MTQLTGDWLEAQGTQRVCTAFASAGAELLFVGGCVRNALLGVPVSDTDLATDALPEQVLDLARAAGIKAVPTGIDHGTVTLIADGTVHEVTTFRRDVSTDGRHAQVVFSRDVAEDAARRDFTMNALYARPDGTLVDPLNGLPDLRARRVRFIGQARDRIHEDYLRSLRYFRFHAWYGDADAGLDPDALSAIADTLDGMVRLSRERIGAEMVKLLAAPDPSPSVAGMQRCGLLGSVLPGADASALAPLIHLEPELALIPDPMLRLATLGPTEIAADLRLSRAQMTALTRLRTAATGTAGLGELGHTLGRDDARAAIALRQALLGQPIPKDAAHRIDAGTLARFPVSAQDLMPGLTGKALGARLDLLRARWIDSGFRLGRDDLLSGPE